MNNPSIIAGFTGTQEGLTLKQFNQLTNLLTYLDPLWFDHGDCIGSDETAHYIALSLGIWVAIHPPNKSAKRAFCKGWKKKFTPCEYLIRNQHIVNRSHIMIATPKEDEMQLRSGTWSTVRYANKVGIRVSIIRP